MAMSTYFHYYPYSYPKPSQIVHLRDTTYVKIENSVSGETFGHNQTNLFFSKSK